LVCCFGETFGIYGCYCGFVVSVGMVGYDGFGWCCCDNERMSCLGSIFDYGCSLEHCPSTLDWSYYHESNSFGLEIDRVGSCYSSHWLPRECNPLGLDGIGPCNVRY